MPHKREALAALGRPGAKGVALIDDTGSHPNKNLYST